MLERGRDYFLLLWPFVVGILCLAIALVPDLVLEKSVMLTWSIFEIFSLQHGVQRDFARLLLVSVGFLMVIAVPAFRDYSSFFPERLKVVAHFDNDGIERILRSLSRSDLRKLNLADNWKPLKAVYFRELNDKLTSAGENFQFREDRDQTLSKGDLVFRLRLLRWGAQTYQIEEARVWFIHSTDVPGKGSEQIFTEAEVDPGHAMIVGSIADVLVHRGLLITPTFKQKFRLSVSKETYDHSLICATRIHILPYPNISETIYLKRQDDGFNVPTGYAVYSLP